MAKKKFSWLKWFGGFAFWRGATFGKLLWNIVVTLLVLGLVVGVWYKMFYQRTEVQQAEQITNVESEKKDGFNLLKFEFKIFGLGN